MEIVHFCCRGSREPCGLKLISQNKDLVDKQSRLARALWIEIFLASRRQSIQVSRLARALWIEMQYHLNILYLEKVEAREGNSVEIKIRFVFN